MCPRPKCLLKTLHSAVKVNWDQYQIRAPKQGYIFILASWWCNPGPEFRTALRTAGNLGRRVGSLNIVARRFMFNKLYNKLSTEFCLFYQFITQKLTSNNSPDCTAGISNSSAVPEIWKTQPGPFRQSSNLCRSLMTRKMGKQTSCNLGKACIIQTPNIHRDILNCML